MHERDFPACPYQAEDGFNDRNRFPHGHLFVGEIENGKRYPFGVYTKEEADDRFAAKETEANLEALAQSVSTSLNDLTDIVNSKASEAEAEAIRARLDALEYVDIKINSFIATPSLCEIGSTQTISLSWSLNKSATSQTIDGVPVTGSSKQFANVSSSKTYTLNVADGKTSATKTASVAFANRIYYGAASDLTEVTQLGNVLSNDKKRTFTVDARAGEYIVYAIPARLGAVTFFVGGFEGGFEEPVEQVLTNASGYQEPYNVYRSTNANLGETTVEVREG
ncbi:MAG: hypothetical protein J6P20_10370 [Oscillospiraceae bacterium]|nr:hypothetical protein [Oscillospiraceae bacterium]